MSEAQVITGDCLEVMRTLEAESVHAIVTDPPYGLEFMGADWDGVVPGAEYWREALRVAKPGAYLLCFGGTRTFHRMACAIEDAGWEIRDTIMWVYGSGFPKSMDVSKAIDKHLGVKRTVTGHRETDPQKGFSKVKGMGTGAASIGSQTNSTSYDLTAATSEQAKEWDGWGTCLKPAWEPIIMARKPLDGTVANNVMTYGTGAINIDGCRVPIEHGDDVFAKNPHTHSKGKDSGIYCRYNEQQGNWSGDKGRFPANLVHDGSQEVVELFPETKGQKAPIKGTEPSRDTRDGIFPTFGPINAFEPMDGYGSAARFFYCAKASKKDRGEGNDHPTVKPTALMEWLVKLVTAEGQTVLDPFMGSGSTGCACIDEGMQFIGIEQNAHYAEIAARRMQEREKQLTLDLDGDIHLREVLRDE